MCDRASDMVISGGVNLYPRTIDFVAGLPRDANGKLAKRHLRAPYWKAAGRSI